MSSSDTTAQTPTPPVTEVTPPPAPVESEALVQAVPWGIEQQSTDGHEAVTESAADDRVDMVSRSYIRQQPDFAPDEVLVPRLRVAQGLTAEVQSGTAKPGQFVL